MDALYITEAQDRVWLVVRGETLDAEKWCHNDPMATRTYIALLRAINVGGNSVMTMADLKAQFGATGFANVRTYIQSGNVLFDAPAESTSRLAERAEQQLRAGPG